MHSVPPNPQACQAMIIPHLAVCMFFQIRFRPQKEIEVKGGGGQTIHNGPFRNTITMTVHIHSVDML